MTLEWCQWLGRGGGQGRSSPRVFTCVCAFASVCPGHAYTGVYATVHMCVHARKRADASDLAAGGSAVASGMS